MRLLGLSVITALGVGCTDNGAHLTFQAPAGPSKAATFKVVLASPDLVPTIRNQRVSPSGNETREVSYYLQRTIAGGRYENVDVDGFSIRVEPDPSLTDTNFIPFVIFYDDAGAVIGMGTYHAADPTTPSSIKVIKDEIDVYKLDVEPATQLVDDTLPLDASQVKVVECGREDQSTFTSGIVWRPASGGEFRLLFPTDEGMDATGRTLDLDCDTHEVTVETSGEDCDDSRGWFHHGADETCDGFDTNCDNLQNMVVACPADTGGLTCGTPGLALCNDRTGVADQCAPDPVCACMGNPTGCSRCVIDYSAVTATMVTPCAPARAYIYTSTSNAVCGDTALCSVEVLRVRGPWKVEVAVDAPAPSFSIRATGVNAKFLLQAKVLAADIPGQVAQSVGEVELAIIEANGTAHLRMWDLQISNENPMQCLGGGPFAMTCTP